MLLSNLEVIRFLSSEVVPCWESLRSVPVVTLDAGGGRVLKRTLGGNTAFFLCSPRGEVVDVYPGVLTPEDFLAVVAEGMSILRAGGHEGLEQRVLNVHRLAQSDSHLPFGSVPISASKALVESPLLKGLSLRSEFPAPGPSLPGLELTWELSKQPATSMQVIANLGLPAVPDLGRRVVDADSQQNRTAVRRLVHQMLASTQRLHTPEELKEPVFKGILHLDLDDPWLGLVGFEIPGSPR